MEEEERPLCSSLQPDDAAASSPRFGYSSGAPQHNPMTPTGASAQHPSPAHVNLGNIEIGKRTSNSLASSGNAHNSTNLNASRTSLTLAGSGNVHTNANNSAWWDMEERLKAREACIAARDARIAELEQHIRMYEVRIAAVERHAATAINAHNSSVKSDERVAELEQKISGLQEQSDERVAELEKKISGLQERLEHRIRSVAVLEDRIGMLGCDLEQKDEVIAELRAYMWQMHEAARRQLGQTLGTRELMAQQLEATDDHWLLTSALLNWARVARDNRHKQSMEDQDGEGMKKCRVAEQQVLKLRSERETLQHRLGDATVRGARLAASLRVQGTRLIDRAFAITGPELQRLVINCWCSAIPCIRLDRSLDATEKRCVDLDRCLQESEVQLREFSKQSDRIRLLEDENQRARERINHMQEERKKVVDDARKHVEDRVMVRLQSAIATVAASWEKEKQDLEATIAELSRGNNQKEANQQPDVQLHRQSTWSLQSSGPVPVPSPRNDPKLIPEAAEFFRKRAVKENVVDAAESLLLAAQSLKKGQPFEKLGRADKRHITDSLVMLGRMVDSSLLMDVVEASKRWRIETSNLQNQASSPLKRNVTEGVSLRKLQKTKLPSVHIGSSVSKKAPLHVPYQGSRAPRYWG